GVRGGGSASSLQIAFGADEPLPAGRRQQDRKRHLGAEQADTRIDFGDVHQHARLEAYAVVGLAIPAEGDFVGGASGDALPCAPGVSRSLNSTCWVLSQSLNCRFTPIKPSEVPHEIHSSFNCEFALEFTAGKTFAKTAASSEGPPRPPAGTAAGAGRALDHITN